MAKFTKKLGKDMAVQTAQYLTTVKRDHSMSTPYIQHLQDPWTSLGGPSSLEALS